MSFRRFLVLAGALVAFVTLAAGSHSALHAARLDNAPPLPSFAEPGIAPDGAEIAFVSGGDIWVAPTAGGPAHLLVSHPATESRPLFSPDGRQLAFVSNRTGNADIFVLALATGEVRRLTFDDGDDQLDAWSRDGRWIYFSSASRDVAGMNDVYRVAVEGGTPMPVSADRYVNEYFAAPSPDGETIAFTARGMASSQWWRKGHSHIDEAEVWLLRRGTGSYERVTEGGAKEMWPMWSGDGRQIFYVSDRGGAQNIWLRPVGGRAAEARAITRFTDGRVLWPTITADGRTIVFERDFGIWKLDTATGQASEVKVTRRGVPAGPSVDHLALGNQIQELAVSPDGKKVAFVVHGEVFAASSKDGGDAMRVTSTPANESHLVWAPDSRRLVYESDRDAVVHLFTYDFKSNTETQLTREPQDDLWPRFSPDGKSLAFERGLRELRVLNIDGGRDRVVARGYLADRLDGGQPLAWSPDGRWIAYFATGPKGFTNAQVVAVTDAGGDARPVTFLANANAGGISWAPDGTFLLFDTGQRTETTQVARVDLVLRTPKFREDQFRDLFQEEPARVQAPPAQPKPAPPLTADKDKPVATDKDKTAPSDKDKPAIDKKGSAKPVEIVFDGIRKRLAMLPLGVDVRDQAISPDGKWLLLTAGAAGQQNLYIWSLDELSRERPVARQLTSTAGGKSDAQFSPDSKDVYYLEDGRIQTVSIERREPRAITVTAEMDVDFAREKLEVFQQAWSYLRDEFFDANFNGANWNGVRAAYEPRIAGASTADEMRRLISLMVGELNASHLGISGPSGAPASAASATGRLGLRFDAVEYDRARRLKIAGIVPLSAAGVVPGIQPGDYLLAVDGVEIGPRTNLDELLDHKAGRRVTLTLAGVDGKNRRDVPVRPTNRATEKGLIYREWVEANRAYVTRVSGGRLGYVHMLDMSANALTQLSIDLDAENHARDGVVVDVRNNNGGFVNVYAIDVFARRGYLTMTQRGLPATPARSILGQRALEAPTILVTNQHSLSDAEDFTEGYRALKLGKVVGEPTAGWIIYTWSARLIDGSSLRLPRTKITTSDGSPMEMHPRPVDVPVTRPIGEGLAAKDSQLDAAITELLKQIGPKKTTQPD